MGIDQCILLKCRKKRSDGVTLHRFPKNPLQAIKWQEYVQIVENKPDWLYKNYHKICSDHFTPDSYDILSQRDDGCPRLKYMACPSVIPSYDDEGNIIDPETPVYGDVLNTMDLDESADPEDFFITLEPTCELVEGNDVYTQNEENCDDLEEIQVKTKENKNSIGSSLYNGDNVCDVDNVIGDNDCGTEINGGDSENNGDYNKENEETDNSYDNDHMEWATGQNIELINLQNEIIPQNLRIKKGKKIVLRNGNDIVEKVNLSNNSGFECHICGKPWAKKRSLVEHLRRHTNERPFKCEYCDYKAIARSDLNKHVRRIHLGIRRYKVKNIPCEVCGKLFYNNNHLKDHMNTHSQEMIYKCPFCDLRSSYSNSIKRHIRVQHFSKKDLHTLPDIEISKPKNDEYISDIKISSEENDLFNLGGNIEPSSKIPYISLKSSRLKLEEQEWTRFLLKRLMFCSVCLQYFKEHKDLREHENVHGDFKFKKPVDEVINGVKRPFKCQCCNYRASKINLLNRHIRLTHADPTVPLEKFECPYCDKNYTTRFHLNNHVKKHHADDVANPVRCKFCNYIAESKRVLDDHFETCVLKNEDEVLDPLENLTEQLESIKKKEREMENTNVLIGERVTHDDAVSYYMGEFIDPDEIKKEPVHEMDIRYDEGMPID